MNELEMIRAQLLGIQAQASAAIGQVNALIARVKEEEEPDGPRGPRFLGDEESAS